MKITSRGRVTIPKAIRDKCGLQPGTEVDFLKEGGELVMVKRPEGRQMPRRSLPKR